MKCKKYLVKSKSDNQIIKDTVDSDIEIISKKTCEIEYDTSKLQIFAVDGCIPLINSHDHECRWLFYTNIANIENDKLGNKKKKFFNQCVVEFRMPPSTMKRIISSLTNEMYNYERYQKKQTSIEDGLKKHSQQNHIMFG